MNYNSIIIIARYTIYVHVNPANGEVYSIQHYVINFVSDLSLLARFMHACAYFFLPCTLSRVFLFFFAGSGSYIDKPRNENYKYKFFSHFLFSLVQLNA